MLLTDLDFVLQVQHIKVSTLTWRQYHLNYYHGMGEAVIDIYNLACKYLQYCGTRNSSELTPIYIEKPGDQMSWEQALPSAAQAMHCLFPGKAHWIRDSDIHDKVTSLKNQEQSAETLQLMPVCCPDVKQGCCCTYPTADIAFARHSLFQHLQGKRSSRAPQVQLYSDHHSINAI